jgi:hypothetical protein
MVCTFCRSRVDRRLEHELQLAPVLLAHAAAAALPARASSTALALSTLYSARRLGLRKRAGLFRMLVRGRAGAAEDEVLDALAVDQQRHRLAHRGSLNAGGGSWGWLRSPSTSVQGSA